jgi:hypothetical protein
MDGECRVTHTGAAPAADESRPGGHGSRAPAAVTVTVPAAVRVTATVKGIISEPPGYCRDHDSDVLTPGPDDVQIFI